MFTLKKLIAYIALGYSFYVSFEYSGMLFQKSEFVAPERRGDLWMKQTCLNLLDNGTLMADDVWKPYGCHMVKYNKFDTKECVKKITEVYGQTYISFVGDSRMRTLFRNLIGIIDESSPLAKHDKTHEDIHYKNEELGLHLELIWEPFLADSMMKRFKDWQNEEVEQRPMTVFVGAGNWFIRKFGFSEMYRRQMFRKLKRVQIHMMKISDSTGISWRLQDPVKYKLLDSFRKNLTNGNLNKFNELALQIFDTTDVPVMKSMREIALNYNISDYGDGLHACCKTARMDTQILLNYICNPFVVLDGSVCCSINSY